MFKSTSWPSSYQQPYRHNNDNENDNKNKNDSSSFINNSSKEESKKSKPINPKNYRPKNDEEEFIWHIALQLEESDMSFLLSRYVKHGLQFMKDCWYKFEAVDQTKIRDKRAFFNSFVEKEARLVFAADKKV